MIHFKKDIRIDGEVYHVNGERFTSVDDFLTTNDSRKQIRNEEDFTRKKASDRSFTLVNNYDEAVDLITNGYKEALTTFNEVLKLANNTKRKVTFRNDVVGFAPIVPNAMLGLPKSMVNTHITNIKTPVIDIYYDSRFSGGTDAEVFIETGKKLLTAIMTLEQSGYKVNLYWCNFKARDNTDNIDVCLLKVKDSNRALDLNRITFPIAHPAMLRVFSFDWMSKVPDGIERSGFGCGLINAYSEEFITEFIPQLFSINAQFIHSQNIVNASVEQILEVIKNGKYVGKVH